MLVLHFLCCAFLVRISSSGATAADSDAHSLSTRQDYTLKITPIYGSYYFPNHFRYLIDVAQDRHAQRTDLRTEFQTIRERILTQTSGPDLILHFEAQPAGHGVISNAAANQILRDVADWALSNKETLNAAKWTVSLRGQPETQVIATGVVAGNPKLINTASHSYDRSRHVYSFQQLLVAFEAAVHSLDDPAQDFLLVRNGWRFRYQFHGTPIPAMEFSIQLTPYNRQPGRSHQDLMVENLREALLLAAGKIREDMQDPMNRQPRWAAEFAFTILQQRKDALNEPGTVKVAVVSAAPVVPGPGMPNVPPPPRPPPPLNLNLTSPTNSA